MNISVLGIDLAKNIFQLYGVGELTATAIIAAASNPGELKNGRHMSAWLRLGLVLSSFSFIRLREILSFKQLSQKFAAGDGNTIQFYVNTHQSSGQHYTE